MELPRIQPIVDAVDNIHIALYDPANECQFGYSLVGDGSVPETKEDIIKATELMFQALRESLTTLGCTELSNVIHGYSGEDGHELSVAFRNTRANCNIKRSIRQCRAANGSFRREVTFS